MHKTIGKRYQEKWGQKGRLVVAFHCVERLPPNWILFWKTPEDVVLPTGLPTQVDMELIEWLVFVDDMGDGVF